MKSRASMQLIACYWLAVVAASGLRAADQSDGEARLRETLRSTMLQLNDVQSQLASLQATQASQADERKALSDQVVQLTKRIADDQAARAKETEALKARLSEQEVYVARLQDGLAQWKAAAEKANVSTHAAVAQRNKESANAVSIERRAEDLAAKNAELFRLASEILDRYEKFGLGTQFLAREPFVGKTRVELENQIQDYDDQLTAQKDYQ